MTTEIATPTLAVRDLVKTFGSAPVLRGVDLTVQPGEFVGLMGPNGAGKSTLIKILDGVYQATSGEITLAGTRVSSLHAQRHIGFVHQDLGLIDDMSIAENLRLGERPLRLAGLLLDKRAERAHAERALEQVSLDVPVTQLVGSLAPGEKTLVAIAKAFARGARILFVDEATSTLPPADARQVIATLAENVAQGMTVVMVSHKLSEILDGTTRVVLLLDGRIAADRATQGLDRAALVDMLLQHEVAKAEQATTCTASAETREPAMAHESNVVLELSGVSGGKVGPVDLRVHRGEVVGLTGLAGSGLHDIALLAVGALDARSGTVTRNCGPVGFVPPHRESQGGFAELSTRHNMTVTSLGQWRGRTRLLRNAQEKRAVEAIIDRLRITPPDLDAEFGVLSGGNKQKVIFGRALLLAPGLYVLCEPTRGVDMATRRPIYELIAELRDDGAAVLLVSSDSEDLLAVCDQIASVEGGRLNELQPIATMSSADLEAML